MAYTGKKPIDHTDVTQSQSMTVTDDLTVDGAITSQNGVYLGGTGSANKLDDYEEGTFSGTHQGSSYTGRYTKIGRIVHITMSINNSGSTGSSIGVLPFSAVNGSTSMNGAQPTLNTSYPAYDDMYIAPYNGGVALYAYAENGNTIGTVTSGVVSLNFVYETDA